MNSTLIWVVKPVRKLDTASQWLKALQYPPGEPSSYPSLDKHQTQITPSAMAGFIFGPPGKLAKVTDLSKQIQAFTSGPS